MNINLSVALFFLFIIGGCASSQGPRVSEQGAKSPQSKLSKKNSTPQRKQAATLTPSQPKNSAARLLLAQADKAVESQKSEQAIILLERAIRIDPREALLWIELSRAHLMQGHTTAAAQHARKAIALSGSDDLKSAKAWLLLADVLEAEGEIRQARELRARYTRYQG